MLGSQCVTVDGWCCLCCITRQRVVISSARLDIYHSWHCKSGTEVPGTEDGVYCELIVCTVFQLQHLEKVCLSLWNSKNAPRSKLYQKVGFVITVMTELTVAFGHRITQPRSSWKLSRKQKCHQRLGRLTKSLCCTVVVSLCFTLLNFINGLDVAVHRCCSVIIRSLGRCHSQ